MATRHDASLRNRRGRPGEVVRLLRLIQARTLELRTLRWDELRNEEYAAKEVELEQLRWRLAAAANRAAREDSGSAA